MRLVFHGRLKELYGDSFEMASTSVADAIEGFFSQQSNHPRDMVIEAIGFDTEGKLRAETDVEEVHLIPSMYGGGGKFFKIALGIALIAAAVFLPQLGVALSATLKTTMITMGAMLALQGVMALFLKAPSLSKSEDPPPSKYLGLNENTVDQGTPITVACGRVQVAGHWLSLQSDSDKLVFGNFPANPT